VSKKWQIAMATLLVIVGIFLAEYALRCYRKPLSRQEALERASAKLQRFSKKFVVGDSLPPLVDESYDPQRKEWTFTFKNSTCTVGIIVDRCHGTDIGGISEGCKVR